MKKMDFRVNKITRLTQLKMRETLLRKLLKLLLLRKLKKALTIISEIETIAKR